MARYTDVQQPWFVAAQKELGTAEIAGPRDNPKIIGYARDAGIRGYDHDEVPWCSVFACAMMESVPVTSPRSAWARDWLQWGRKLKTPVAGCVVVFDRGNGNGHVAFACEWDEDTITVLGGNQSDMVCYTKLSRSKVLGYRWPVTYPVPGEPTQGEVDAATAELKSKGSRTMSHAEMADKVIKGTAGGAAVIEGVNTATDAVKPYLDTADTIRDLSERLHSVTDFLIHYWYVPTAIAAVLILRSLAHIKFARVDDYLTGKRPAQ